MMSNSFALPWQERIYQILHEAVSHQRLPHALLFHGEEGIGKKQFAEELAQGLLCLSPSGIQPCGQCKSCLLFLGYNHPDFFILEPEEKGKQIKIDDVREAREKMEKTSQQGGAKVMLICPVEAMNENASNALLKTLEEPSSNSYLVLVSHAQARLLATIRSRCQRYDFEKPSFEQAKSWVKLNLSQETLGRQKSTEEMTSVNEVSIEKALFLSSNKPLLARELIMSESLDLADVIQDDLSNIIHARLDFIEAAARWKKYDFNLLVQTLCALLLELTKLKLMCSKRVEYDVQEYKQTIDFYGKLKPDFEVKRLFVLYEYVLQVKEQGLSRANINRDLLLENLILHCKTCLS